MTPRNRHAFAWIGKKGTHDAYIRTTVLGRRVNGVDDIRLEVAPSFEGKTVLFMTRKEALITAGALLHAVLLARARRAKR